MRAIDYDNNQKKSKTDCITEVTDDEYDEYDEYEDDGIRTISNLTMSLKNNMLNHFFI